MSFSPIANAYAGTAAGGGSDSGLIMIVYILVFGAIIYFMMIRPQMKKSKEQRHYEHLTGFCQKLQEYIEKIAREELGLSNPGERVYIGISGE